jgi:hypothetical protein
MGRLRITCSTPAVDMTAKRGAGSHNCSNGSSASPRHNSGFRGDGDGSSLRTLMSPGMSSPLGATTSIARLLCVSIAPGCCGAAPVQAVAPYNLEDVGLLRCATLVDRSQKTSCFPHCTRRLTDVTVQSDRHSASAAVHGMPSYPSSSWPHTCASCVEALEVIQGTLRVPYRGSSAHYAGVCVFGYVWLLDCRLLLQECYQLLLRNNKS